MTPARVPPDLCLVGAQVADVRARELRRADIAITGPWITGMDLDDALPASAKRTIDLQGHVLVPGYVEPHTHAILANPVEYGGAMLAHGTTTAVVDSLPLMMSIPEDRLPGVLEELAALPIKLRWMIRIHPQSFADEDRFRLEALRKLWRLPSVAAVGEVTRWRDVFDGDPDLVEKIRAARADGKRVEGHAPGASYERLKALAEIGFTSCHEAITPQEVEERLRAGLYAMLRHSSIRPDLPQLLQAVTPELAQSDRLMLTADGPTPAFIEELGYQDYLISTALHSGIPAMVALRMATWNPAAYYGMTEIGEIAPGKRADVNVLRRLDDPRPVMVIADGEIVAQGGALVRPLPPFAWKNAFAPVRLPPLGPEAFAHTQTGVVFRLTNDVVTEPVTGQTIPADTLQVALIDRRGRWITRAQLSGFVDRLGGLATTISSAFDPVVIGQRPSDMAQAFERLAAMGGGLVVIDGGKETFALPLDLGGAFSSRPWVEVAASNRRFNALMKERGYRFSDPIFSLLFLTFDSLPWVRLTSRGVWDVRQRRVLAPPSAI